MAGVASRRRQPSARAGVAVEAALVLSVREAAEAVGLSPRTFAERVLPALSLLRTSDGTLLVPQAELDAWKARRPSWQAGLRAVRPRGRPPVLKAAVMARIARERAQGRSLSEIARGLEQDGVPTARGGSRWWPSSVRWALGRSGGLEALPDLQADEVAAAAAPEAPAGPAPPDAAPAPRRARRRRRRTGSTAAGGGPASA